MYNDYKNGEESLEEETLIENNAPLEINRDGAVEVGEIASEISFEIINADNEKIEEIEIIELKREQEKKQIKHRHRITKKVQKQFIVIGVAVIALIGIIAFVICGAGNNNDDIASENETTEISFASAVMEKDMGVEGIIGDSKGMKPNYNFFGEENARKEIREIVFTDSLAEAPINEYFDLSEERNGSVKGWYDPYDEGRYYIGAEGGVIAPSDCTGLFANMRNLKKIDFNDAFHTENVIKMQYLFYKDFALEEINFTGVKTESVITMNRMFEECEALKNVDCSEFDTSNVKDMFAMFRNCKSIDEIDLSKFVTYSVNNMSRMFEECNNITSIYLSENFDTSKVKTMAYMFYRCYKLEDIDVSEFDTEKVINMYAMFAQCRAVNYLDVTGFNTENVEKMSYMFNGCRQLKNLDVSSFDISKVIKMKSMFKECEDVSGDEDWERLAPLSVVKERYE